MLNYTWGTGSKHTWWDEDFSSCPWLCWLIIIFVACWFGDMHAKLMYTLTKTQKSTHYVEWMDRWVLKFMRHEMKPLSNILAAFMDQHDISSCSSSLIELGWPCQLFRNYNYGFVSVSLWDIALSSKSRSKVWACAYPAHTYFANWHSLIPTQIHKFRLLWLYSNLIYLSRFDIRKIIWHDING